jgi:hypothetical protein
LIVFLWLAHLNENAERRAAELGLAFELLEVIDDLELQFGVLIQFAWVFCLHFIKPRVLEALSRALSLCRIDIQHFFQ